MENLIEDSFKIRSKEGRASFIAYLCAGDPNYEISLKACKTLIKSGIDILELGVPFSDPLADGITNQLAAERALNSNMNNNKVFSLVEEIKDYARNPIVLYTYYNLIFSYGLREYIKKAKKSGVDALLTLDLPPEESTEYLKICKEFNIKTVFIIAPTSSESRIKKICDCCTGFIYYVSREGVTGERKQLSLDINSKVEIIRKYTSLPIVVGFGVSKSSHIRKIACTADGVVVGSSLVNCIADNLLDEDSIFSSLKEKINDLCEGNALKK